MNYFALGRIHAWFLLTYLSKRQFVTTGAILVSITGQNRERTRRIKDAFQRDSVASGR